MYHIGLHGKRVLDQGEVGAGILLKSDEVGVCACVHIAFKYHSGRDIAIAANGRHYLCIKN